MTEQEGGLTGGALEDAFIDETNAELENLAKDAKVLKELQGNVTTMVTVQGETLKKVETNVDTAHENVRAAVDDIEEASSLNCTGRKLKLIIALVIFIIVAIIALICGLYFGLPPPKT